MTTDPMPGGRRRIDRVLSEGFLDELSTLPLEEVRQRRREAEQEEADLSFVRRMLQGRADLIRDELTRRNHGGPDLGSYLDPAGDKESGGSRDEQLVHHLTDVLADGGRGGSSQSRFLSVEPSRVEEHRRAAEQLMADVGLSDLAGSTDEQLTAALAKVEDF